MSVESPERIWIESEGGCPYFYHEDELSDVGSPVTEYVRADKLRAEVEALRAEVDALARENEAMRRCAIRYLRWLGVTHKPLDAALREDMANPDMCGDAALAQENRNG